MAIQLIESRIAHPRVLRLIRKCLKAGVMEGGVWSETQAGTPQGAVISPLLSNGYGGKRRATPTMLSSASSTSTRQEREELERIDQIPKVSRFQE
jgi:retron-type reverse transcriptase